MSNYPTDEDVAFARDSGFFKDINEPWSEGKIANIIQKSAVGKSLQELTSDSIAKLVKGNPQTAEVFAKGALVVNRIPLAAIGFDPSRTNLETTLKNVNIAGAYNETTDRKFVVANSTGTIVHESVHRGLKKLKELPEARELLKDLPSEESIVRYLMATQAGNPERGTGSIADKQIDAAEYAFDKSLRSKTYKKNLDRLTEIAQEWLAKNRPGGYRR